MNVVNEFCYLQMIKRFVLCRVKKSNFSVSKAHETYPSINIIFRTVFIVDNWLVIAQDVEAEAIWGAVVVEKNASEQIGVIQVCARLPNHFGRLRCQSIGFILIV